MKRMKKIINYPIPGKHGKPILTDIFFEATGLPKPVVVFAHGFKGFKDWGHFNLVAEKFATEGFVFAKFNFSHNGTTPEQPLDFADLEAFGNNNFSIELDDLGTVIDFVMAHEGLNQANETDPEKLYLTGHSRGGGIVILKAAEDSRVRKIVTWAAVNDFEKWTMEQLDYWKETGAMYIENSRTKQSMPLYYQLYEDYMANKNRLHIPTAVKKLSIPFMLAHGTNDEAVPYESAIQIHEWNTDTRLLTIEGGNHVFGASHPYMDNQLPHDAAKVIEETIKFLKA